MEQQDKIQLPAQASMRDFQDYIEALEAQQGWSDVDLVHNCFLMGEEVGELFAAVRRYKRIFDQGNAPERTQQAKLEQVGEELVDVFNYLLAIANRLHLDLESEFRKKNAQNQDRHWEA